MSWIILFVSLNAHAEPTYVSPRGEPTYTVETNPNVYTPSAFAAKDSKTGAIPTRNPRPDALPNKQKREQAFARVPKLADDVGEMDELDRDLLYVRARTISLKELKKIYPRIAEKKLQQLQKVLAKNE